MPRSLRTGRFVVAALAVGLLGPLPAAAQRLQGDPRAAPAPAPTSLQEVAASFVPTWEPLLEPRALRIPDEGEVTAEAEVEQGVCYAAVGFSDGIPDLDVWVRVGAQVVAQNVEPDAYPVALWCAEASGIVAIALSAYTTGGDAWLGVYREPESFERSRGGTGLASRLDAALARSAPRWRPDGLPWLVELRQAGTRDQLVTLPGSECVGFLGVGSAAVGDLDLALRDAEGTLVAVDLALDTTPALVYCAPAAGEYRLEVTVARGRGQVAVQRLLPPRP